VRAAGAVFTLDRVPGMRRVGLWPLAALLALLAACARPSTSEAEVERVLGGLDLRGRVAQMVLVAAPLDRAPTDAVLADLRRAVVEEGAGGVWIEGGPAQAVAEVVASLRAEAALPLLVATDVDEGVGARIPEATDFPAVAALGALATEEGMRDAGRAIGREARALGIDLGVVRGPAPGGAGPRSLPGWEPERVGPALAAFRDGAEREGLALALDLFPPGAEGPRRLDWDRARVDTLEMEILEGALEAGFAGLLPGSIALPALAGDETPLQLSAGTIGGLLRRDLGWDGVVAVDLGRAGPDRAGAAAPEAAVRAVAAGADLLLGLEGAEGAAAAIAAIVAAVEAGAIPASRVEGAARRVLALKLRPRAGAPAAGEVAGRLRDAQALAAVERLAEETALLLAPPGAGAPPTGALMTGTGTLLVTPAGRGGVLAGELTRALPGLRHLALEPASDPAAAGRLRDALVGARGLLVAEFPGTGDPAPEPALREAAPPGSPAPPRLRIVFGPPSLEAVPAADPVLVLWGTGALSQQAAARILLGSGSPRESLPERVSWPPARTLQPVTAERVGMSEAGLQRVDAAIQAAIARGAFPGAALAVGRRGGLVRLRGYGALGAPAAGAVDAAETVYDLASLTKVMGTTAAVMLLVDEGRMELDAPVERYLSGWSGDGKERVTVRHLLAHTSGLPPGLFLYRSARSPGQAVRQVLDQPLRRRPGERAEYSDLGMILLAEAVERAAEAPLDRLLARRAFAPLGMSSTMYLPPLALNGRIPPTALTSEREFVLHGIVHDGNAFRLGGVAGHAGLFSTARDVAVFAQMLLNGGSYGTVRLLRPETVAAFATRQPGADQRALGWDTPGPVSSAGRFFSARAYGHTGYTGTSLWIDPALDLFVVLLTNRTLNNTPTAEMLRVRAAVHDAVAQAITDQAVARRPGSR
jgi:beta-N-acetylhexosaminidase